MLLLAPCQITGELADRPVLNGFLHAGEVFQFSDDFGQRLPFDVLHTVKRQSLVLSNLIDGHDSRVIEIGRSFSFRLETLDYFFAS